MEVELGMLPRRLSDRLIDGVIGKSYFRRWTSDSLEGLRKALQSS